MSTVESNNRFYFQIQENIPIFRLLPRRTKSIHRYSMLSYQTRNQKYENVIENPPAASLFLPLTIDAIDLWSCRAPLRSKLNGAVLHTGRQALLEDTVHSRVEGTRM